MNGRVVREESAEKARRSRPLQNGAQRFDAFRREYGIFNHCTFHNLRKKRQKCMQISRGVVYKSRAKRSQLPTHDPIQRVYFTHTGRSLARWRKRMCDDPFLFRQMLSGRNRSARIVIRILRPPVHRGLVVRVAKPVPCALRSHAEASSLDASSATRPKRLHAARECLVRIVQIDAQIVHGAGDPLLFPFSGRTPTAVGFCATIRSFFESEGRAPAVHSH